MSRREIVGVCASIHSLMSRGLLSDDWVVKTKRWVASAVEARMAGMNMAVMSCAGSGNQDYRHGRDLRRGQGRLRPEEEFYRFYFMNRLSGAIPHFGIQNSLFDIRYSKGISH